MEQLLEKTYFLAGDNNYYQRRTLLISICFWIFANVLPTSLSYFETMPTVNIYNSNHKLVEYNVKLNYTICDNHDFHYQITHHKDYSIISSLGFECNKDLVALLGSSVFAGGSIGSMFLQLLTNSVGRKISYSIAFVFLIISLLIVIFKIHSYAIFLLFFLIQLFTIILAYNSIINLAETCCPKLRSIYVSVVNMGYSLSGLIFTLVYYLKFTWIFALVLAISLMIFFTICFISLTVSSPRLYVSKGDYIGFYKSIRYISKINGRWPIVKKILPIPKKKKDIFVTPESEDEENILKKSILEFYEPLLERKESIDTLEKINTETLALEGKKEHKLFEQLVYDYFDIKENNNDENNEISDFKMLIEFKSQRNIFLIQNYSWFSITGIYYSISILLKLIPGNLFLNAIMLYSIELISYAICVFLLNYLEFGRKKAALIFMVISTISCILLSVLDDYDSKPSLILILILRFGISGAYNINFIYSLEIYPTLLRLTGFGINCNMGCFSALLFPAFIEIDMSDRLFKLFIFLLLSCIIFERLIPDTNGSKLTNLIPETLGNDEYQRNSFIFKKAKEIKLSRKKSYFESSN